MQLTPFLGALLALSLTLPALGQEAPAAARGQMHPGPGAGAGVQPLGCPPSAATLSHYNGSDINLDRMFGSTVVIGGTWVATLVPQPLRAPGPWLIRIHTAPTVGPALDLGVLLSLPPAGISENLLGGSVIGIFTAPPHLGGSTTNTAAIPIPDNCALVGMPWAAQAVVMGDLPGGSGVLDPWFSSASQGVIGTF